MSKRNFSYGARKSRTPTSPAIDEKTKQAITMLVRSIEFAGISGGTCALRALVGSIVLERFGIEHRIVLGGLLYRAGPNPHDVVFFAHPDDNQGHYPGHYHCWIETTSDLIDFSSGDWKQISDTVPPEFGAELPPVTWEHPPAAAIWYSRLPLLSAWREPPWGPRPGEVWYTPLAEGSRAIFDAVTEENRPMVTDAVDKVFMKFHLPVFKIFQNDKDRDDYMRENRGTFVLID